MLKLIHPLDAIREKVIAADGSLKLEKPFTTQGGDTVLAVLFRQSGTVVGSLVFAGTSTEPSQLPVGEGLYDLSLSGTDIVRLREILDPTGSGYKKISILTLARMMYLLIPGETVPFSSSPYDQGLNWRLTLASVSSDPNRDNDSGLYYILYAPSCKNSSYFWDGLSGMTSHEADDISDFLENQPYPEDRPDEDGRVYIKTEDWNEFLRRHPELEYDAEDVSDYTEKQMARDPETASCEGVSSCVTDTRTLPSDITVDVFRCPADSADIQDSMQLDSGQEFVSLEGHCGEVRFRIRVHVVGDVRVIFRDEMYRHASDMPEELRDSYRVPCDRTALALSDGGTYDTPYRCDNNNWFEVEMEMTCGPNDPEMPFAPDFIDVPEDNSPEGWKAYLLDIVKDTLTEPTED